MRLEHTRAMELQLDGIAASMGCDFHQYGTRKMAAIGSANALMGDVPLALTFLEELPQQDSAEQDTTLMVKDALLLADAFIRSGEARKANELCALAMRMAKAKGDALLIGYAHLHTGEALLRAADAAGSVAEFERAMQAFDLIGRQAEVITAGDRLAMAYFRSEANTKAAELSARLIDEARSAKAFEQLPSLMHTRARALEAIGDVAGSAGTWTKWQALRDSLQVEAREEEVVLRYARFRSDTKDEALQRSVTMMRAQKQLAEQERRLKIVYSAVAALLAVLAVVLIGRARMKRRAALALARSHAEVLHQKERAEASEQAKDRFLANMSHEMRTPLNAMLGFTDLLLHDGPTHRARTFLTNIHNAGDHLLVLINDVLDVSRMDAGKLVLANTPFDLHRCVQACREILEHRASEQRDTLRIDIASDVPQWIIGDAARLSQILLNLLGNALKFTEGGDVHLRVQRMKEQVRFTITDTGIGIADEKLDRLFDRFMQVDANDQRKHGGAGLGLSIVKELVDLHGGTITVESARGEGSEFIVDLPLHATGAPVNGRAPSAAQAVAHNSLAGSSILVAEDNEMNALLVTETLKRLYPEAHVMLVGDGQQALDRITADTNGSIGLVLMDIQMPVMDGLAATRAIRALNTDRSRVPIIALTANALHDGEEKCRAAGMNDRVTKPFRAEDLRQAIARCTGAHGNHATPDSVSSAAYAELYDKLMPERLQQLRNAHARRDLAAVQDVAHTMAPQLEQHDAAHFSGLLRQVERLDPAASPSEQDTAIQRLINAIASDLA